MQFQVYIDRVGFFCLAYKMTNFVNESHLLMWAKVLLVMIRMWCAIKFYRPKMIRVIKIIIFPSPFPAPSAIQIKELACILPMVPGTFVFPMTLTFVLVPCISFSKAEVKVLVESLLFSSRFLSKASISSAITILTYLYKYLCTNHYVINYVSCDKLLYMIRFVMLT